MSDHEPLRMGPEDVARDIVMLSEPFGARAEAIRALRTNVISQHIDAGRRALAVCAASEGVGCTFIAANLAVAMSQVGLNTLLIDADLRKPSVQTLIPPLTPGTGLGQCLAGGAARFADFFQASPLEMLSVMYAGERVSNPQELLGGEPFHDLIENCLREFDITIVDTPPADRFADARRIASIVGHSLIVARRNVTLVEDVKTLIGEFNVDHAHVVGTVLNEL